jgi:hypothetical protein
MQYYFFTGLLNFIVSSFTPLILILLPPLTPKNAASVAEAVEGVSGIDESVGNLLLSSADWY